MGNKTYDHIIAGAGLAGLSLAYRLSLAPEYKDRRLLILDKDAKQNNDRTWCFWSREEDLFEGIVHHRWPKITFADKERVKDFQLAPYNYKMIRGIDFYNHTLNHLRNCPNIEILQEQVDHISETDSEGLVKTSEGSYTAAQIFKSFPDKLEPTGQDHFVWQHFKGLIIETEEQKFDPQKAIFMDFRVDQKSETRFFYVLPLSKTKALVEFTIFSETVSAPEYYDSYLETYLSETLGIKDYQVLEDELGAIPMTTHNFQQTRTKRIIPIGTNGGSVKASSGYAFSRIQKHLSQLVPLILNNKLDQYKLKASRYQFYDRIMLNAILSGKTSGYTVFSKLFQKLSPQTVFKFLDEEGSFFTDLKMFSAPPTIPFLKAFLEEIRK